MEASRAAPTLLGRSLHAQRAENVLVLYHDVENNPLLAKAIWYLRSGGINESGGFDQPGNHFGPMG
jgi:hypothetical protein